MNTVASGLAGLRYIIGALGLFAGFYYYFVPDPAMATAMVTLVTTGFVGLIAFLSHVVFYRSDAERLGEEAQNPFWQWEVGFSNLGFSLAAFVATLGRLGTSAQAVVLLGYAVYLLQAGVLAGIRHKQKNAAIILVYSLMMLFFAVTGLLWP